MLKIKLARFGKRHQPYYRIVVNEARDKRDGKYVAALGQYAPSLQPKILKIDLDAYKQWLTKGAQPTDTVANLVKRYESGTPFPPKPTKLSKKAKAKAAAKTEAPIESETAAEVESAPEPKATAETNTVTEPETVTEPQSTEAQSTETATA